MIWGNVIIDVHFQDSTIKQNQVINENLKQSIARYKHPKKIIIVKQLPRNAMGKVQKNILRSEYKSLFTA